MLTVEKHRSILKKCDYNVKYMTPYGYHQKIMLKLGGENNVSQKVNNFIRIDRSGAEKCVTTYPILGYSADMNYDFIKPDDNA